MELDETLLWFALAGGVVTLLTGLRTWRAGDRVYLASGAFILALTGLVYLLAPSACGYAGTGAWLVLVLAPNLASRAAARSAARRDHRWAIRWTQVVYVLHPSATVRQILRDRRAALDLFEGRFADAEAAFRASAATKGVEKHAVELSCLRVRADWEGTIAYYEANVSDDDALAQPLLLHSYLRALGELGRRNDLVHTYDRFASKLTGAQRQPHRVGAWLFLFAFSGEVALVERLFKRLLSGHAPELAALWKITAELASGATIDPRVAEELASSPDAGVRAMLERRRRNAALLVDEPLDDAAREVIASAAKSLVQEDELGSSATPERRPIVVYVLIVLNVLGFLVEVARSLGIPSAPSGPAVAALDTTSDWLLTDCGAFHAPRVVTGEWWRLGTYMFLHAGFLHITMNLLAFYMFGPFVERALGRAKFVALYLLAGLAGSTTLLVFQLTVERAQLSAREAASFGDVALKLYPPAVGASGCVMGVIGATMAILGRAWLKERAAVAGSRLMLLVLMIGVQTVIDLTQKQISFKAHAAGLVAGLVFGALFLPTKKGITRAS